MDHVAIVVRNLDDAIRVYENLLGVKTSKVATVPDQGVKAAILPVAGVEIELLEPINPESGIAKFLESRGEGLHHICLEVEDVDRELAQLQSLGVQLIDKKGRPGLAGKVGFLHPKSTRGVLVELAEKVGHP